MFPLDFPLGILKRSARQGDVVLDPFAGRGTTLYAARLLGLPAYGIDSNPVAVAISEAKLANTTPARIISSARRILEQQKEPIHVPNGTFWRLAFNEEVLITLCRLREGLLANCQSDSRKALRALILGSLHGPLSKLEPSYFSNQSPRTFAPKPAYAIKYWQERKLIPPRVDALRLIERRANRCFTEEKTIGLGGAIEGDSRKQQVFKVPDTVSWIITSPPYYGMRTYIPDQWLRWWFLGGPETVDYSNAGQLAHTSQETFRNGLSDVWKNCATVASDNSRLIVRFGAINDRRVDHLQLVKDSLQASPWRIATLRNAGTAAYGKRQADQFVSSDSAIEEFDIWARLK